MTTVNPVQAIMSASNEIAKDLFNLESVVKDQNPEQRETEETAIAKDLNAQFEKISQEIYKLPANIRGEAVQAMSAAAGGVEEAEKATLSGNTTQEYQGSSNALINIVDLDYDIQPKS